MTRLLFLLMLFGSANWAFSQKQNATIPFSNSKVVVQLLSEDPDVTAMMKRAEAKHPGAAAHYKKFISDYNSSIRYAAKKYWSINRDIEFEEGDIKMLSSKYQSACVIFLAQIAGSSFDAALGYETVINAQRIYGLSYKLADGMGKTYSFPFPITFKFTDQVTFHDIVFTLQNLQHMINHNLLHNGLTYPVGYAESLARINCPLQKNKTLLADSSLFEKSFSIQQVKEAYTYYCALSSTIEIDNVVRSGDSTKAYIEIVPYQFSTRAGDSSVSHTIITFKVVVNAGDGRVLNFQRNVLADSNLFGIISLKDLTALSKCKIE